MDDEVELPPFITMRPETLKRLASLEECDNCPRKVKSDFLVVLVTRGQRLVCPECFSFIQYLMMRRLSLN